jgi:hypothetical protein
MSNSKSRAMRLDVKKTYKLFIGGAFPRSESGRTYEVKMPKVNSSQTLALPPAKIFAMPLLQRVAHTVAGPVLQLLTADRFFIASQR